MRGWLTLLLISAACGGGAATGPMPALPAAETRATLVGPRCTGARQCRCRDEREQQPEQTPPARYKRYEVRIGPVENDLWVTVDDMVLYKSRERATECFYIDLLPGKHSMRIHGRDDHGLAARVRVSELSAAGPWWYPAFELDCNGMCTLDGLRGEQARVEAAPRGLLAACGSTKIKGYRWQTGRLPDSLHPEQVAVELVLDIYEFATKHPPGSSECER